MGYSITLFCCGQDSPVHPLKQTAKKVIASPGDGK